MPEDTGISVRPAGTTENEGICSCNYSCENGYEAAAEYATVLEKEGYEKSNEGGEDYWFYKPVIYDGETSYVKIIVHPEAETMKVKMALE